MSSYYGGAGSSRDSSVNSGLTRSNSGRSNSSSGGYYSAAALPTYSSGRSYEGGPGTGKSSSFTSLFSSLPRSYSSKPKSKGTTVGGGSVVGSSAGSYGKSPHGFYTTTLGSKTMVGVGPSAIAGGGYILGHYTLAPMAGAFSHAGSSGSNRDRLDLSGVSSSSASSHHNSNISPLSHHPHHQRSSSVSRPSSLYDLTSRYTTGSRRRAPSPEPPVAHRHSLNLNFGRGRTGASSGVGKDVSDRHSGSSSNTHNSGGGSNHLHSIGSTTSSKYPTVITMSSSDQAQDTSSGKGAGAYGITGRYHHQMDYPSSSSNSGSVGRDSRGRRGSASSTYSQQSIQPQVGSGSTSSADDRYKGAKSNLLSLRKRLSSSLSSLVVSLAGSTPSLLTGGHSGNTPGTIISKGSHGAHYRSIGGGHLYDSKGSSVAGCSTSSECDDGGYDEQVDDGENEDDEEDEDDYDEDYEDFSDCVGRDVSSDVEPGLDSSSNRSENGVSQRINYRKLYEEVLKENQLLKSKLSRAEEDISELKLKLEKLSMTPRITTDDTEKQEKRALERKLSEMEEELKEIRHLRTENQKLRDENGALIRVISKLSK